MFIDLDKTFKRLLAIAVFFIALMLFVLYVLNFKKDEAKRIFESKPGADIVVPVGIVERFPSLEYSAQA